MKTSVLTGNSMIVFICLNLYLYIFICSIGSWFIVDLKVNSLHSVGIQVFF